MILFLLCVCVWVVVYESDMESLSKSTHCNSLLAVEGLEAAVLSRKTKAL